LKQIPRGDESTRFGHDATDTPAITRTEAARDAGCPNARRSRRGADAWGFDQIRLAGLSTIGRRCQIWHNRHFPARVRPAPHLPPLALLAFAAWWRDAILFWLNR